MTTRDEARAAVAAVIAEQHASYFLRHEVHPAKAFDATVDELLGRLVWPVLERLDTTSSVEFPQPMSPETAGQP